MGGLVSRGELDPPICPKPLIFTGTEITDCPSDPAHPSASSQGLEPPRGLQRPSALLGLGSPSAHPTCTPHLNPPCYALLLLWVRREVGPKSHTVSTPTQAPALPGSYSVDIYPVAAVPHPSAPLRFSFLASLRPVKSSGSHAPAR